MSRRIGPNVCWLLATLAIGQAGPSEAQEVSEQSLSILFGRPSVAIPETLLIPIRSRGAENASTGWMLVYRNFETSAKAPKMRTYDRTVSLPGRGRSGKIVWEIINTVNASCTSYSGGPCPDIIRVVIVPEGYIALPQSAVVDERESIRIMVVPSGLS